MNSTNHENEQRQEEEQTPSNDRRERKKYEAPRLTKKRSVSRVTLFSGGGATAGGLTASG